MIGSGLKLHSLTWVPITSRQVTVSHPFGSNSHFIGRLFNKLRKTRGTSSRSLRAKGWRSIGQVFSWRSQVAIHSLQKMCWHCGLWTGSVKTSSQMEQRNSGLIFPSKRCVSMPIFSWRRKMTWRNERRKNKCDKPKPWSRNQAWLIMPGFRDAKREKSSICLKLRPSYAREKKIMSSTSRSWPKEESGNFSTYPQLLHNKKQKTTQLRAFLFYAIFILRASTILSDCRFKQDPFVRRLLLDSIVERRARLLISQSAKDGQTGDQHHQEWQVYESHRSSKKGGAKEGAQEGNLF